MNVTGLHDYQPAAVEGLLTPLRLYGAALDGSDMGVGKTAHACAVVRELQVPTLVLVPPVSISGWLWMAKHLGTDFDIQSADMVRTGRTPWGWWDNPPPKKLPTFFVCTSCQCKSDGPFDFPCPHHFTGIHCVTTKKKPHDYGKFNWHPGIKLLVLDEIHKFGALDSLQSDMLIAARRQRISVLGLSGTVADSPLGFRGLGYVLGLHSLVDVPATKGNKGSPGFYRWAQGYGCRRIPMLGLKWAVGEDKKRELTLQLHREIFPVHGVRVRIKDLGDKFPECQITAELIDLDNRLASLYEEMREQLRLMNERRDLDAGGPLSQFLRLRQEIGLLKMPVMAERGIAAREAGHHVAFFVNYRAEVDALCRLLGTKCRVDGSQTAGQIAAHIAEFQADSEPFIVCTSAVGGISINLQDLHGNFPRWGEIQPGYSAREFRQVCGRLPRSGSKSKSIYRVLFAAGTPEEKVHRALALKLNIIDTLNDGDLLPIENLPLDKLPNMRHLV